MGNMQDCDPARSETARQYSEDLEIMSADFKLVKSLEELSSRLADAQILAMNILSSQAILGCGQFEGCYACPNQKYCLQFMARKYLERYGIK